MKNRMTIWAGAILATLLALVLPSCITAEEHDSVTYDAGSDEFHMLAVMTDIGAKEQGDLDYLGAVYKNRDHLVMPVIASGANVFPLGAVSMLRMADNKLWMLNLYTTRPGSVDTLDTKIPLDTLKITPGQFFGKGDSVGYYQAVTVPGKTIDTALAEISTDLQTADMGKGLQAEIERRAGGGKVYSWADMTAQVFKAMTQAAKEGDAATQPGEEQINPLMVMEEESLKNLIKGAAEKSLAIHREKSELVLALPLDANDAKQAAKFIDAVRTQSEKEVPIPDGKDAEQKRHDEAIVRAVIHVATVTATDNGIRVGLDLVQLSTAVEAVKHIRIDLNDKDSAATQPAVNVRGYLNNEGIAVDENLTLDQLQKDFLAGNLKANPSPKPLPPGEGVASTQAGNPPTAPVPQP